MAKKTIEFEVKSTVGKVAKDTKKLGDNSKKAAKDVKKTGDAAKASAADFTIMGLSLNGVRAGFSKIIPAAKMMFGTIKAGLISTGIGVFVVILGTMIQYFRDSEAGMSKFREITAQIGVVLGNVTDIVSDFGKAIYALSTGNWKMLKDAVDDVTAGLGGFVEKTKEEMVQAKELEVQRQAMRLTERKHVVDSARRTTEIQKLRLQAREEENFGLEERAEFLRRALLLSDEQMNKDIDIMTQKAEFQRIENGFSKSSTENLDALAALEANVFQIEGANYAKRKLMTSELVSFDKQIVKAAEDKVKALENLRSQEDIWDKEQLEKKRKSEEMFSKELQEIYAQADKSQLQQDFEALTSLEEQRHIAQMLEIDNMTIHEDKKNELRKAAGEVHLTNQKALSSAEAQHKAKQAEIMIGASAGLAKALLGLAGENKAIASATVVIDTAMGVAKAISSNAANLPLGLLTAATIAATGIKSLSDINKTDVPSSGGTPSLSAMNASAVAPAPAMSGRFSLGSGNRPEAIKAYVVTDEMTDSQSQLNNIRERATL